jgi:hypothetical protein
MVKILSSVFKGPAAALIQKAVNSDLPGVFSHLTGLIAITVISLILTKLIYKINSIKYV